MVPYASMLETAMIKILRVTLLTTILQTYSG